MKCLFFLAFLTSPGTASLGVSFSLMQSNSACQSLTSRLASVNPARSPLNTGGFYFTGFSLLRRNSLFVGIISYNTSYPYSASSLCSPCIPFSFQVQITPLLVSLFREPHTTQTLISYFFSIFRNSLPLLLNKMLLDFLF